MQKFEDMISYIRQYFLKKDEQLEIPRTICESSIIDIDIVKRTARTIRRVGIITVVRELSSDLDAHPDQKLLRWNVGKRVALEDNQQTIEWLHQGWILKEVRLKNDGKSLDKMYYRMGYLLYTYLLNMRTDKHRDLINQFTQFKTNAAQKLNQITYIQEERRVQLEKLAIFLFGSLQWNLDNLETEYNFPENWSLSKRINSLDLLLAFFMISSNKEIFDWKEIGAQYYPGIGGSKAFDAYKEELLNLLEKISGQSLETLGMISGGQITPIYFAGHLKGTWSNFLAGPVHALTNISVAHDHYSTDATTLWLVENRAVLTRMSAEPHFLQDTNSLIISVDGHLRSAHKKLIRQLFQTSRIGQAIFWSDYDEAGLQIAEEMLESLKGHTVLYKWVCPDHSILTNWLEYRRTMENLLQHSKSEQELVLGEAADWRRWINH